MCQGCLDGWWRRHDQIKSLCSQCGWTSELTVVIVFVLTSFAVWFLAMLTVDAALWGTMHAVIIRLLLSYFTAVSVLARIQPWEIEHAFGDVYSKMITDLFQNSLGFDGGLLVQWMGLECIFGKSYKLASHSTAAQWPIVKSQTVFWSVAPCVWMPVLGLVSILVFEVYTVFVKCRHCLKKEVIIRLSQMDSGDSDAFMRDYRLCGLFRTKAVYGGCRMRFRVVLEDSVPLMSISYFLMIPTLLRQLIITLSCETLGKEATEWRLLAAPEVACWTGDHLPWAIFAIFAILIWGLLLPGLMTLFLWRRRASFGFDACLATRVGWLSDGFESGYVYWEGVVHFRRVVLILIGMWPELSRASELALYQVTGVAATLLHLSVKPYDNRAGELLDEIELYGLNLFQMLVMSMQVVLLADPNGAIYDLVTVFFTFAVLIFSTVLLCSSLQSFNTFCRIAATLVFSFMVGFCFMDEKFRHPMAFGLVFLAYVANALFVLWAAWKVFGEIGTLIVDESSRMSRKKEEKEQQKRVIQDKLVAEAHSRKKGEAQATSPSQMALAFRDHGTGYLKRMQKLFFSTKSGSGALIHFDAVNGDLVLGLHPDTYMNDPNLSAYTRRMLARLGPFLTDEEREFVSMSLHDAIYHVIVDCDIDKISVSLLEFLLRYTFARHFHKRVLLGEKDDEEDDEPKPLTWGEQPLRPAGSPSASMTSKASISNNGPTLLDLMFDDDGPVFKHGMTAVAFQAQLMHITMLPRKVAEDLLHSFIDRRACAREHTPESSEFGSRTPCPSTPGTSGDLPALGVTLSVPKIREMQRQLSPCLSEGAEDENGSPSPRIGPSSD